jgi:ABC-type uncharacterized transport system substrate-binding protein
MEFSAELRRPWCHLCAAVYGILGTMTFRNLILGLYCAIVCVMPAQAHPHVWVTMHTELVYTSDGRITGVRHAWTFDDMFSAFATQGS